MEHKTRIILIISTIVIFISLLLTVLIIFNSPYYPGFESDLFYLSPDLSENREDIRARISVPKKSSIKIVFEIKDESIEYSVSQFRAFLDDLEIQIWNDHHLDFAAYSTLLQEQIPPFSSWL